MRVLIILGLRIVSSMFYLSLFRVASKEAKYYGISSE